MFESAQAQAIWKRLLHRFLTSAGTGVATAVANGATHVDVTFARSEPDTAYGVLATPSWGTTVYVSNKAVTGCRVNFGTAAGASATVDWATFRSED